MDFKVGNIIINNINKDWIGLIIKIYKENHNYKHGSNFIYSGMIYVECYQMYWFHTTNMVLKGLEFIGYEGSFIDENFHKI